MKDQNGKVISPETPLQIAVASPQNINPGETAWYIGRRHRNLVADKPGEIAEAVPSFSATTYTSESDQRGTRYLDAVRISDLKLTEENGELIATGIVENTGTVQVETILIYVNLYNDAHLLTARYFGNRILAGQIMFHSYYWLILKYLQQIKNKNADYRDLDVLMKNVLLKDIIMI